MAVTVDVLNITLRVRARPRAPMLELEERKPAPDRERRIYLSAPPAPAAMGEAAASSSEDEGGELESALSAVDLDGLSARVYELLRYDVRVGRERSGGSS